MPRPSLSQKPKKPRTAAQGGDPVQVGPETVLLAVTGDSPAILTETVWALAQEDPPIVPTRVAAITTSRGARRLSEDLDGGCRNAVWQRLRRQIEHQLGHLPKNSLTLEVPRVLTAPIDGHARPLEDVRTREDNDATADFILEQVRGITANPETRLIASIAGGRKTMGALLYAAVSLLGREGDRVTHVLVNEPFDRRLNPPFFFPTAPPTQHTLRDGDETRTVSSDEARIQLAEVPFVPLRNAFAETGASVTSFRSLMDRYSRLLRADGPPPRLEFRYGREPAVLVNEHALRLENRTQVLVIEAVARLQSLEEDRFDPPGKTLCSLLEAWLERRFEDDKNLGSYSALLSRLPGTDLSAPEDVQKEALDRLQSPEGCVVLTRTFSTLRTSARKTHLQWFPKPRSFRLPAYRLATSPTAGYPRPPPAAPPAPRTSTLA